MTRIVVDRSTCMGIGMCETQADDYFRLGEDSVVEILAPEVEAGDDDYVRAAVAACPFSALSLA